MSQHPPNKCAACGGAKEFEHDKYCPGCEEDFLCSCGNEKPPDDAICDECEDVKHEHEREDMTCSCGNAKPPDDAVCGDCEDVKNEIEADEAREEAAAAVGPDDDPLAGRGHPY